MLKVTQKQITQMINEGYAIDLTNCTDEEIEEAKENEFCFDEFMYSSGEYGCNGKVYIGMKTQKMYAINSRSLNLFKI